ncbi:hypothetical protein Psi02_09970 [Planotetraspora silvatica]|uniref:Uncharacterized protein n=1 Tax=Planotetraspora silvatica TaxID=234614 RepID=A0A8J3UFY3_9ACTN|nr:hypothetical protein [Planotetraspora silvatica]GII44573.1 hypothetical protein Psi02_09970 [Planotetraspora silvatica]
MAVLLGDKHRFGVEVGDWDGPALRRVDLWVAGQWLTCEDNAAFVAQFRLSVAATADRVRSGGVSPLPFDGSPAAAHRRLIDGISNFVEDYERFWIFNDWGPTTDNVLALLFRDGDQLVITSEFCREDHLSEHPEHAGTVFVAELQAGEFVGILEELVAVLDHG